MLRRHSSEIAKLLMDLDLIRDHSVPAEKLTLGVEEVETYSHNSQESIPDYGE